MQLLFFTEEPIVCAVAGWKKCWCSIREFHLWTNVEYNKCHSTLFCNIRDQNTILSKRMHGRNVEIEFLNQFYIPRQKTFYLEDGSVLFLRMIYLFSNYYSVNINETHDSRIHHFCLRNHSPNRTAIPIGHIFYCRIRILLQCNLLSNDFKHSENI